MSSLGHFSEDQLFAAALAYEASGCNIPMEEFLQNIEKRFEEAKESYRKNYKPGIRTGSKSKLGL